MPVSIKFNKVWLRNSFSKIRELSINSVKTHFLFLQFHTQLIIWMKPHTKLVLLFNMSMQLGNIVVIVVLNVVRK